MRRFRFHLAAVLFWFCAFAAHADGFRASYTPEAQPGGPPQRACNGCSCSGGKEEAYTAGNTQRRVQSLALAMGFTLALRSG